jgi:hypothetical protein
MQVQRSRSSQGARRRVHLVRALPCCTLHKLCGKEAGPFIFHTAYGIYDIRVYGRREHRA